MTTKATLYLDADLYRALKVKAALSDQTVSATVNAILSRDLEGKAAEHGAKERPKVEVRLEGKMRIPVLHGLEWSKGHVFDRSELYD